MLGLLVDWRTRAVPHHVVCGRDRGRSHNSVRDHVHLCSTFPWAPETRETRAEHFEKNIVNDLTSLYQQEVIPIPLLMNVI